MIVFSLMNEKNEQNKYCLVNKIFWSCCLIQVCAHYNKIYHGFIVGSNVAT